VTTAPANSGVRISAAPKVTQIVFNATANTINIWPQVGMALLPSATDAATALTPGRSVGIVVADATHAYVIFNSSSFG
jgi:hypothetical protein